MSSGRSNTAGFVLLLFSILNTDVAGNKTADMWRQAGRLTGLLLNNCMQLGFDGPQEQFPLILEQCLKRRSLVVLDRSLKSDVIELANGIELVRYRQENDSTLARDFALSDTISQSDQKESTWKHQILKRIAHVFSTHVLKIRFNGYEEAKSISDDEARGRRKHNMLISLVMFGVAAVGLIMVPMGFQFLAVLGGKALLLAKMALILTAIQGLKKIATSNVNYGLYSTHPEPHCKDEFCDVDYRHLEDGDSVFVSLDVDHLNDHDIDSWHYERQWPYEADTKDAGGPYRSYHPAGEPPADLLHPRIDSQDYL